MSVEALQVVSKACYEEIKDGAESKEKGYRCLVWASEPQTPETLAAKLGAVRDLMLQQDTPIRVSGAC